MSIKFDPKNNIIRLCILGITMKDNCKPEEAAALFLQAWNEATNDFEKFIAAYHKGRNEQNILDRLKWLETSLRYALEINDDSIRSAYPLLYLSIAKCYEELGDSEQAKANYELSNSFNGAPSDKGPFYHGTRADLQVGELLIPGHNSNYKSELVMNHIYFTSNINGAGLAASLAKGDGKERIYIVEPTGSFENDPNVTDKKLPGNLTCSYRSLQPLKIIGEEVKWRKETPQEINQWREKLDKNKGEIIN